MANKYCNLPGTSKIKDTYDDINDGFQAVQDDIDNHASKTIAYRAGATRDTSLSGTQKITLPFSAKAVLITAAVEATNKFSDGKWANGYGSSCVARREDNIFVNPASLVS